MSEYEPSHRCPSCRNLGFCASDCVWAPWNMDAGPLPRTRIGRLLRKRRWLYNVPAGLGRAVMYPLPGEAV